MLAVKRSTEKKGQGSGFGYGYGPLGGGVSYQSICGSSMPLRTIAVSAADLGLKYDSKSVLSSSWTTVISVCSPESKSQESSRQKTKKTHPLLIGD